MHLIQGTLDSSTTLLTSGAAVIALGSAFYGLRHQLSVKQIPSLLALSCLVFLAQMVNCPIGFGFSIHLVCLLYTSPSPRDVEESRMPSSA